MSRRWAFVVLILALLAPGCSGESPESPAPPPAPPEEAQTPTPAVTLPPRTDLGTIEGRVALLGRPPGNRVIRMSMDPKCAALTEGQLVIEETVAANEDGDLANVFVQVDGDFPRVPPPSDPVRIDQRDCVYVPRVAGMQVGQTLEILNSDDLSHNVRGSSVGDNDFNIGQPRAGMVYRYVPEEPEMMFHLSCDVHRWMNAFLGVAAHPYFDVTDREGTFRIEGVPAGTYTLHTWHEVYGELTETVEVTQDETTTVELAYMAED